MLSLPQPGTNTESNTKIPSIDLPESSTVFETLLRLIYPMVQPNIESMRLLSDLFHAAEKYDMQGVLSTLRLHLREPHFLDQNPVLVFALACRFQFTAEAKAASRASLMSSTRLHHEKDTEEVLEQAGFKVRDYMALHSLRDRRITQMQEYLDGDGFEGVRSTRFCLFDCIIANVERRMLPTLRASPAPRPSKIRHGLFSKPAS